MGAILVIAVALIIAGFCAVVAWGILAEIE